jgi:hypothetical protein
LRTFRLAEPTGTQWVSHQAQTGMLYQSDYVTQAQKEIDNSAARQRYSSGHKKGRLKNPIHLAGALSALCQAGEETGGD